MQKQILDKQLVSSSWPQKGQISFQNVTLNYTGRDNAAALKGINFEIKGGEKVWKSCIAKLFICITVISLLIPKIGIVGRTGAGKSSIIATLFRLTEPSPGSSIRIDDVDTLLIGLHELRSKIGVIPQDPILFKGTLRQNLDPSDDDLFDDAALWRAVKEAHLDDVAKSGGGLDAEARKQICLKKFNFYKIINCESSSFINTLFLF